MNFAESVENVTEYGGNINFDSGTIDVILSLTADETGQVPVAYDSQVLLHVSSIHLCAFTFSKL